jgi:hypothetical protein
MRPHRHVVLSTAITVALSGGAFVAIGSLATPAGAAGAFGTGTPEFVNSAAPSSFSGATVAGEPSVGVNWKSGAGMYMAGTSTARLTFDNNQTPPAVTWTDVSSPYSDVNLDPILATDHATGTTIAGGDDGPCAVMSTTTTDGGFLDPTAWTPSTPCPFTADHPTIGMGPYAGTPPVNATAPFVSYFCQQSDLDSCSHSVDGGLTWSPSVPDSNANCLSLFGHVKVSADGTAYIPSVNCFDANSNNLVGAITSTDNGQSLSGFGIAGAPTPADGFDPSIATDANNRVYESWSRAGDYQPVVTWSDNHGQSWAPQVDLASTIPGGLVAATFESAVAGDGGRAAVAYLGTPTGTRGQDPFTAGFHGVWYLYVSYTYDGGATWQTVQATPDPVQRGEIDAGGTTTSGQRNLLDFMDASLTKDGRVLVAYADGCLDTCNGASGTEAQSTNQYATVAYQSAGVGMFAAFDAPAVAPAAPTVTAAAGNSQVSLGWSAPADGGSAITGYRIYRGTTSSALSALTTVAPGTSFVDTSVTPTTTYYYQLAAINSVGEGAKSAVVSATPTTVPSAPTLSTTSRKSTVTLSWNTPADGGAPITGWQILRGTTATNETLIQTLSTGTSYVDTTGTAGTTYVYQVDAVNRNGAGVRSNTSQITVKKGG